MYLSAGLPLVQNSVDRIRKNTSFEMSVNTTSTTDYKEVIQIVNRVLRKGLNSYAI